MSDLKPIIGLEVHIELDTISKMFCECPAEHFRAVPNSQTCPVCLGLPGALPYANQKAIDYTIKLGLALGCKINKFSKFDRKHYFYPDLPKSYQISQYDLPFCESGVFELLKNDGKKKSIRITRIHLEEDTGKLVHKKVNGKPISLIDYNRSGVPLLELVTEPDFSSAEEATEFVKELQLIVRYLNISGADMEKGSMRLEANVSVAEKNSDELPDFKVELKNINSFRFMERAVNSEIKRMLEMVSQGKKIVQETRGYDENSDTTFSQRSKEEAKDYRYFPEPDLPPVMLSDKKIKQLGESLSDLPALKRKIFKDQYQLPDNYIDVLISDKDRAGFFESAVKYAQKAGIEAKAIANLMINQSLDDQYDDAKTMVAAIKKDADKDVVDEEKTREVLKSVIASNNDAANEYRSGKTQVAGFFIGQVQKELKGKADPNLIREILEKELK